MKTSISWQRESGENDKQTEKHKQLERDKQVDRMTNRRKTLRCRKQEKEGERESWVDTQLDKLTDRQ